MVRIMHFPGVMDDGGVETVVMNWYRRIDHSKFQFDFFVPRSYKGKYDDEIIALGGRIITIPRISDGIFEYFSKVDSLISKYGPYNAAHIHAIHSGIIPLLAIKKAAKCPVIYHAHSTNNAVFTRLPFFKSSIERICRRFIKKYADLKLACGEDAGKFVFGDSNFTIMKNAIDLSYYIPDHNQTLKEKLNIPKDSIVLGNVARFVKEKNQDFIVKLIAEDKRKKGKLHAVFVGSGDKLKDIKKLAFDLDCDSNITFVGAQNDMPQWYNIMDVFCLPSSFEGLGLVAIEAQACGIPCITSLGVPEETNQRCVGFSRLSLNDSTEAWLDSIYRLSNSRSNDKAKIHDILTENGYNINHVVTQLEFLYQNCAKI